MMQKQAVGEIRGPIGEAEVTEQCSQPELVARSAPCESLERLVEFGEQLGQAVLPDKDLYLEQARAGILGRLGEQRSGRFE
jgi:hypothetical protein